MTHLNDPTAGKIELLRLLAAAKANGNVKTQITLLLLLASDDAHIAQAAMERVDTLHGNALEDLLGDASLYFPPSISHEIEDAMSELVSVGADLDRCVARLKGLVVKISKLNA
jgi:hypothetical protein